MTITAQEEISERVVRETYLRLLTDPKLQAELLISFLTTSDSEDFSAALLDFESALQSVERRLRELVEELWEGNEHGGGH